MTYYTVKSTWIDGMIVSGRPMTLARAEQEFATLNTYKIVTKVEAPRAYTGKISRRDWVLIEEDAEAGA
jgi:hypothetical protein